ncbi:hypothetical protein MTO96_038979, partial [Rhipicephalus appendiculatus]
ASVFLILKNHGYYSAPVVLRLPARGFLLDNDQEQEEKTKEMSTARDRQSEVATVSERPALLASSFVSQVHASRGSGRVRIERQLPPPSIESDVRLEEEQLRGLWSDYRSIGAMLLINLLVVDVALPLYLLEKSTPSWMFFIPVVSTAAFIVFGIVALCVSLMASWRPGLSCDRPGRCG